YSSTKVSVCYVKGVVKGGIVEKLREKISKIDIDVILDSAYIAKFLTEHNTSLFKQIGTTEKPDILVSRIMEGRAAIIVDGSPFVLTVPYLIVEDFQSADDYYSSSYRAFVVRILRASSVFVAILLPALFVAAQLFHLQLLPLSFLLTIVNSIKGIPLSPSFEMFFTLMIFETLNEASIRMPKYVGMAVSIVGGLVLGETAVNAGIISAPALMIIAISGICLYTVPELVQTFSLLRLIYLCIAGSIGGYGLILVTVAVLLYLVSFESYDTPLLAPFAPLVVKDLKDGAYKGFLPELDTRPLSLKSPNRTRIKLKKTKNNDE
ncbi:MAG: spore germination protein, partial [Clostridia bacterium]|nr:spore germination protein [Clostridia bacterium]